MCEQPFYTVGDNLSMKQLIHAVINSRDIAYCSLRSWLIKSNCAALAIILPCALLIFLFGVINDGGISDKVCYMTPVPFTAFPFIWAISFWFEYLKPRKQALVGKKLMKVYYPDAVIRSDNHPDQIYFESGDQEICLYCRRYRKDDNLYGKTYCFYTFYMLFVSEVYLDEQCFEPFDFSVMLQDVHAYLKDKRNFSALDLSENLIGIIVDPRKPISKEMFDTLMSERDYIMKRFKLRLVSLDEYYRIITRIEEILEKKHPAEAQ